MILSWLLSIRRPYKQTLVAIVDFILISLSIIFSVLLSGLNFSEVLSTNLFDFLVIPIFTILIFKIFGVYRSVIRYIDFSSLFLIVKTLFLVFFLLVLIKVINVKKYDLLIEQINEAGLVIFFLSCVTLISIFRVLAQYSFREIFPGKKVVIYGAGRAGIQLGGALRVSSEMEPIAFIDDNKNLHNSYIGELKILAPSQLGKIIKRHKVEEVLVAMPSTSKVVLQASLKNIEKYPVKVRILPGLSELAQGKVSVSELKEVEVTDLLGRQEVSPNMDLLNRNIKSKVVMITGAGGSIGSELSRQVSKLNPDKLILIDSSEYSLYLIKNEIERASKEIKLHAVLANVTNQKRISEIIKAFHVDTIYHAAAYKHVPLVEENPFEGVVNNIIGTKVCVEAAIEAKVETFVLVSTDKAVRPTNIMGATKRFAEMILQSLAVDSTNTKMLMVRFGNVIGSSGSAIPLFQQQIKDGGPVTVTHPDVVRYFMSIPEASQLVIQAGAMGVGGDVFVLDMGQPVKILELAKRLINLSGMTLKENGNANGDIEIIFTGLRPGEKLYEELLIGDNVSKTKHKQILRAEEILISRDKLENYLEQILKAKDLNDIRNLKKVLQQVVMGYEPEKQIVDIVYLQNKRNLD